MNEEIEDFLISDRVAHHVYSDNNEFIAVAVNPDLPGHERRALELEIKGHQKRGVKDGRRTSFKKNHELDFNPETINLIKIGLEDHAESWIEEVKEFVYLTNEVDKIASFIGESTSVAQAAVDILKYRGEVPEDFCDT